MGFSRMLGTTVTSLLVLGVICNVLALALVVLAIRASSRERLLQLRNRAIPVVVLTLLGCVYCVINSVINLGATAGVSSDPSQSALLADGGDPQQARVLAEAISQLMNGLVAAVLLVPVPVAVLLTILVMLARHRDGTAA